jgi:GDPmannose 4,6-dehydratase
MWLMLQRLQRDNCGIAVAETYSVREFLDAVFARLGLDACTHLVVDPRHFRPAELDLPVGDASEARAALEWEPKVKFLISMR